MRSSVLARSAASVAFSNAADVFGGTNLSIADVRNGPRLLAAARIPIMPSANGRVSVRDVTAALGNEPVRMLDVVDAALHFGDLYDNYSDEAFTELEEILRLGGSVWEIKSQRDGLTRRVDPMNRLVH